MLASSSSICAGRSCPAQRPLPHIRKPHIPSPTSCILHRTAHALRPAPCVPRWAALNLTAEAEHWIRANNEEKLYALGSQPPLTLAIHGADGGRGRCQPLPSEWHLDCLGCLGAGRIKTAEQLATAKLYHWNGPNKPFRVGAANSKRSKLAHAELFAPYSGKGEACDVHG